MPIPPVNPNGSPQKTIINVNMIATAGGADATFEAVTVPRTGYLTRASFIAAATLTGADTNSRTQTVVAPTTRVVTDGIVVVAGTAASKGPWLSPGPYVTGDVVTYNNQAYVAIASATTEAPTDTTKWQPVNAFGLGYLTSRTAAFTQDDVGKTISGTGFTSAVILAVQDATTAQVTPNSAIRNALSTTIGASRTLATQAYTATPLVTATADVPKDMVLSTTDTKVYKGDVIKVVSTHIGTGTADPGGVLQLEITNYGEGSQ